MKWMMIYSYNILLYWYWSWRFTPITKSYRGDERWREVLNVEKEDVEMKVVYVELVENEMVDLNVPHIGSNWGWGKNTSKFTTIKPRITHTILPILPKPIVSIPSFSYNFSLYFSSRYTSIPSFSYTFSFSSITSRYTSVFFSFQFSFFYTFFFSYTFFLSYTFFFSLITFLSLLYLLVITLITFSYSYFISIISSYISISFSYIRHDYLYQIQF